jgi:hypothetical protein
MDWDMSEWVESSKYLRSHDSDDFWLEIEGQRVTYEEAVQLLVAKNKLMDELEFGPGPALYRGTGGRMLSSQDIRNLKHLKVIAGGDGDGIAS